MIRQIFSLNSFQKPWGIGSLVVILGFSLCGFSSKINTMVSDTDQWMLIDSWWPVFLGNFIALTQIIFWHASKEVERKIRNVFLHGVRVVIRAVLIYGITWLWLRDYSWDIQAAFFMFLWGVFAVEFDIFYALLKGHHWLYLGKVSLHDKVFRRVPEVLLGLDVCVVVGGIVWFFI